MTRFDKIIFSIIFGSIIPIVLFLAGWWSTLHNSHTLLFAFLGLSIGLFLDYTFLNSLVKKCFNLKNILLIGIYLFYSIGMFGFFMGIPVFHPFLGILAGYYFGKRLFNNNASDSLKSQISRNVASFTSAITFLVCCSSAFIALWYDGTANELQMMLNLQTKPSQATIIAVILIGGISLIFATYRITRFTITKTISAMQTAVTNP